MFSILDGRDHFFQWDLDQRLIVNDATINEVHFCNKTDDCALVCEVYTENGQRLVDVPNILLQNDWLIRAYAYCTNHTIIEKRFKVLARSKPANYVYTETEIKNYDDLAAKIDAMENDIGQAVADYLKENPIDDDVFASKEYVDNAIASIDIPTVELTGYATEKYVNDVVGGMGEKFSNAFKIRKKGEAVVIADMSPVEKIIDAKLSSKNIYGGEANPNSLFWIPEIRSFLYPVFIPSGTQLTVSCDKVETTFMPVFAYFDEERNAINSRPINLEHANGRIYCTLMVEKDVYYICVDSYQQAQSTNYQVEVGATLTPYTPFIDNFENVKVEQYGKNLLPYPYVNTTKTLNGITFTDNGDGSVHVKGIATGTSWFMLSNTIDFGGNINSIERDSATNGVYAVGKRMFYGANNKQLSINIPVSTDIDEILYPQVELGTTFTGYEPYKKPIIHEVDADGTVKGLTNVYPTMTIKADTAGVLVEVEYNQDINDASAVSGLSAYEVAVKNGFKGSETDWLESLKGEQGAKGDAGYTPQREKDYWTTDDVNTITAEAAQKVIEATKDYIVDQGKIGIWSYRKWASGIAECWGIKPVSAKVNLPVGQMFASVEMFSETFPLTFAEIPMVNVTAGATPYMSLIVTAGITDAQTTTTNTGAYKILRATTTGDNPCNYLLNYDVKGYWK